MYLYKSCTVHVCIHVHVSCPCACFHILLLLFEQLVSQGVASSGLSELIVAIGRSQDPQSLSEKLVPHLDALLKIVQPTARIVEGTPTFTCVYVHRDCNTCVHVYVHLHVHLELKHTCTS